jgi:GT2 family glycosyltransferase
MITVVIPFLNQIKYTDDLLNNISNNEVLPEKIILIDDFSTEDSNDLLKKYNFLPIEYVRHSLNYAWNHGISLTNTPLVSVLNNDIIINKYFFKKIIESFNINDKLAVVCPLTTTVIENISLSKDEPVILKEMGKREGWAWTAKMSFLKRIDPIPSILRTYCGDDYIFTLARYLTYNVKKMTNNYVYHYGGRTINETKECWDERSKEKVLWNQYREKNGI